MGYEAWDIERIDDLESQLDAEKARADGLYEDVVMYGRANGELKDALADEKARADEAEAMLRLHFEDGYTTYEDFLADLKRRVGGAT
jgi:hypothetical protein